MADLLTNLIFHHSAFNSLVTCLNPALEQDEGSNKGLS